MDRETTLKQGGAQMKKTEYGILDVLMNLAVMVTLVAVIAVA